MRAIIRRLAQTELDGGNLDVAAVAALARCVNARMLRDVLPGVDPEEAEAWLRSRSFAEPLRDGVTLHDLVRRAVRSDLRRARPGARARAAPPHRRPSLRARVAGRAAPRRRPRRAAWRTRRCAGASAPTAAQRYRVDEVREGDTVATAPQVAARSKDGDWWWTLTEPFFLQAPERVCVVRDTDENLCGFCISVSPHDAPAVAEADPLLGPWLAARPARARRAKR